MQLILNGGGSGPQISNSYQKYAQIIDKNKPLLYIPLAWKNNNYEECLTWLKSELTPYGITKYEMITDVNQFNLININDYNSIFIGGGNTYQLLKFLKESNGFDLINNYLKNRNGIIFGGSAGAIIFGNNIKSCNICSDDVNKWSELDTTGFDVLNGQSLACHYGADNQQQIHDQKLSVYKASREDVTCLTESQSLYIYDDKTELINN